MIDSTAQSLAPTEHGAIMQQIPENLVARMEPVMWEALCDIAHDSGITVNDLVDRIDRSREWDQGLTAAIRVYIVKFYRRKCAEGDS